MLVGQLLPVILLVTYAYEVELQMKVEAILRPRGAMSLFRRQARPRESFSTSTTYH